MNIEPTLNFAQPKAFEPRGITLTDNAASFIRRNLQDRNMFDAHSIGVRFGVTGAGCGGFSYIVEYVDIDTGEDYVFDQDGIKIFVDKKSIMLIDGSEVNYIHETYKSGLVFNNPLANQTCGCGESFSV